MNKKERSRAGGAFWALPCLFFLAVSTPVFSADPSPEDPGQAQAFQPFQAKGGYFSCDIPVGEWHPNDPEPEFDPEYDQYDLELSGPRAEGAPVMISVTYFGPNSDFSGYEDFLRSNSRNVAGETRNKRENYGPIVEADKDGRKVFSLERERLVYLHPQTKSDESVQIKEKLYVVPAGEGFYVLHLNVPSAVFEKHLPVFEKVFLTFAPGIPAVPGDEKSQ